MKKSLLPPKTVGSEILHYRHKAGRPWIVFLLSLLILLCTNSSLYALPSQEADFRIYGHRQADDWRDSVHNSGGQVLGEGSNGSYCGTAYLMRCYVNDLLDSVILRVFPPSGHPGWITNNHFRYTVTDENNTVLSTSAYYPVDNYDNPPVPLSFSTTGVKKILFEFSVDNVNWAPAQYALIAVIENPEDASLVFPNNCLREDDTALHFSVAYQNPLHNGVVYGAAKGGDQLYFTGTGNAPTYSCDRYQRVNMIQEPVLVDHNNPSATFNVYGYCADYKAGFPMLLQNHNVDGTLWDNLDPARVGDFYLKKSEIDNYISYWTNQIPGYMPNFELTVYVSDSVRFRKLMTKHLLYNPATIGPLPATAFHTDKYIVSGTEVWTPANNPLAPGESVLKIKDSLIIPYDTRLYLTDLTIEFGEEGFAEIQTRPCRNDDTGIHSRIVCYNGGVLKMTNSTLTGYTPCDADTTEDGLTPGGRLFWKGVYVQGNSGSSSSQVFSAPLTSLHGILWMDNGSEISHAGHCAASAWDARHGNFNKTGGIIIARNSRFFNNRVAADFQWYYNFDTVSFAELPYRASFFNCDFEADREIPGVFNGFISGWGVRGVRVNGCRFYNSIPGHEKEGYGVYGHDFGFTVDRLYSGLPGHPSVFSNLNYGVYDAYVGGIPTTASVTRSTFNNNKVGIYNNGNIALRATQNEINIPEGDGLVPLPKQPNYQGSAGIILSSSTGYTVHSNSLSGQNPARTVGIMAWNSGAYNNLINNNSYNNLFVANLANYQNKLNSTSINVGLQYHCNEQTGNMYDLVSRGADSSLHGIAANQGSQTVPAGNTFSIGGQNHQIEIYNPTPEVGGVEYWYYTNGTHQQPTSNYGNVTPLGGLDQPQCTLIDNGDFPINWNGGGVVRPADIASALRYYLNDSLGLTVSRDSVHALLGMMATPYADLVRADLYVADSNISAANTVYNTIVSTYDLTHATETAEYNNFGRRLLDLRIALRTNNLNDKQLNGTQVAELETIADSATGWALNRAQAWLQLYDGRTYANPVLLPVDDGQNMARTTQQIGVLQGDDFDYKVFPNPVDDFVTIDWNSNTDSRRLVLTDVNGKMLKDVELKGKQGTLEMDLRPLAPGIYFYQLIESGQIVAKGKLLKQ